MRRHRSNTSALIVAALGVFGYGVEHWRRRTASRAGHLERERFATLAVCLVGDEGAAHVDRADETRRRLRRLAMETTLDVAPSWMDRCLPVARALAIDGTAVDATGRPGAARTQLARRASELTRAMSRVGLVWQVRAGDPETDLDVVAELLARTSAELALATGDARAVAATALHAPVVAPLPVPTSLEVPGLFPMPLGTPAQFLVGGPAPSLSMVTWRGSSAVATVRANAEARAWSVGPNGVLRVLAEDGAADGLAPVLLDGVDAVVGRARAAAPPARADVSGVLLDGVVRDGSLWLGESVRGQGPVLARLPVDRVGASAAVRLAPARSDVTAAPESVAVADGLRSVFAAYTAADGDGATVRVARAVDGPRATVQPVTVPPSWRNEGPRRPGLAMCRAGSSVWLVVAGRDGWRAGEVGERGVDERWHEEPHAGSTFDDQPTLRCDARGVLAYGRERPRAAPVLWCDTTGCVAVAAPRAPQPLDLPSYATPTEGGRARPHSEWPMRFQRPPRGGLVAARLAGTVVAVQRRARGASDWEPERVVLDAAAAQRGAMGLDVELYGDAERLLLAVTVPGALQLLESRDEGRTWHAAASR